MTLVDGPKATPRRQSWAETLGWVITLVLTLNLSLLLHDYVITSFSVPSPSMQPTLDPGDRIIVDRLSYDLHSIHRGDIVVFHRPAAEHCGGPEVSYLVKRVIGLPGDRISSQGNTVLIDGRPLSEPWLPQDDPLGLAISPMTVPTGDYYVLGDNRDDSCDSRYWGVVQKSLIVGRVDARIWPIDRIHWF